MFFPLSSSPFQFHITWEGVRDAAIIQGYLYAHGSCTTVRQQPRATKFKIAIELQCRTRTKSMVRCTVDLRQFPIDLELAHTRRTFKSVN